MRHSSARSLWVYRSLLSPVLTEASRPTVRDFFCELGVAETPEVSVKMRAAIIGRDKRARFMALLPALFMSFAIAL